jgi:hypothetical protein
MVPPVALADESATAPDDPLRVVPFDAPDAPKAERVPRVYDSAKRFNVRLSPRSRDILRWIAEDLRSRGVADPVEPPGVSDLIDLALAYIGGRSIDWRRVSREMTEDREAMAKRRRKKGG